MKLPVATEYLELALNEGCILGDLQLSHCRAGKLQLPTGKLIACDPLIELNTSPFNARLPIGAFRVTLSIAQLDDQERIAFATIHFKGSEPVKWRVLSRQPAQKKSKSRETGYPVDSAIGCFVDAEVAATFCANKRRAIEFDELHLTNVGTWSWGSTPISNGNLVAFTSGYGDGSYFTYAGNDEYDQTVVVVTDFKVIPQNLL